MSSHSVRVALYAGLVLLAFVARRREQSRARPSDGVWPPFWGLTSGLLAAMAVGRAGDIGPLLSDLARGRAADDGWYDSRQPLQAAIIATLGAGWVVMVAIACWRTPERRIRYLPLTIMVTSLAAYAAVRVVSLHQVDALLHRREVAGIRVGILIEFLLLIATAIVTTWVPVGRSLPVDRAGAAQPHPSHY